MKIQNIYHLLQAALLLLLAASCTQEEFPAAQDKARQLTISVTDGGYNTSAVDGKITRAVENGYTTEFTEGDACGFYMVRGGTKKGPDMTIDVYGATWCGDCRQAKNTLDKLGAAYTWHNIEEEEGAADRAVAISGQMHIPVVRYDDGSFQVEPSAVDIKNKLQELGLLAD